MRTTLDIDDDVLALVKEMAAKDRRSAGAGLSSLARKGFHAKTDARQKPSPRPRKRNGVRMLPRREEPVSLAHVRRLMDEEGI